MSNHEFIAFMCAVSHTEFDHLETILKEYDIGHYILSAEVTPDAHAVTNGEHFHFCVQMSSSDYHKYSKRVFKDKYKLRGQARDGIGRQYGKVTKIENVEKMKQYTLKHGKYRTNMPDAEINELLEKSYIVEKKETKNEQLQCYLKTHIELKSWVDEEDTSMSIYSSIGTRNCAENFDTLVHAIIVYHLENKQRIPPQSVIKTYIKSFISEEQFISLDLKSSLLYRLLEIRNPFMMG